MKLLQQTGVRYDLWNVFSDWLYMFAAAISNSCDPRQKEEREAQYMRLIKKYNKETQQLFPQMCAELTMALDYYQRNEGFHDVLGEVFHALELHNKWKGQFFSPQSIADMCGMLVTDWDNLDQDINHYGYVSLNEPCCGAGSMIFGFLNGFYRARKKGNHSREVLVYGGDLDERCVCMTYIQCSLYGIPAVIEQRNAITQECRAKWYTPLYIWHGWHFRERHARQITINDNEVLAMLDA